ncbi:hypothetical protein A9Q79_04710 [Methylophaga sp. 42_25_T18]|nr:hypothetical protein A9Q79_04710 [Methylophaga sp. 42_25_T18]
MAKKIKIRIVTLGAVPYSLDLTQISNKNSSIFEFISPVENFNLNSNADGENWSFTDSNLSKQLPEHDGEDFLIALTNVQLELNWYSRRLKDNCVVFTFHEIAEYLYLNNIPIENVVYRLLYAYSLVYLEGKNRIPASTENTNFTHDETKGCIYDMNGHKYDIIHSCDQPIICDACSHRLASHGVSTSKITQVKNELTKIKKKLYYRTSDWISKHPVKSLILATLWGFVIGMLTNFTSNIFGF